MTITNTTLTYRRPKLTISRQSRLSELEYVNGVSVDFESNVGTSVLEQIEIETNFSHSILMSWETVEISIQIESIEGNGETFEGRLIASLGLSFQARGYSLKQGNTLGALSLSANVSGKKPSGGLSTIPLSLSLNSIGSKPSVGRSQMDVVLTFESVGETPGEGGTSLMNLVLSTITVGSKPSGGFVSPSIALNSVSVGSKPSGGSSTSSLVLDGVFRGQKVSNGSVVSSISLNVVSEGSKPSGGASTAGLTLGLNSVGVKPSGGAVTAGMTLSLNSVGETPAGSSPPTVVGTATTGTPAAATSFSITKPTSAAEGEQLWAHIQLTADRTITLPSGWNFAYQNTNSGAGRAAVIWKLLGAGEPSSYTINLSGSAAAAWGCVRVSGANSTPVNISSNNTTINSWTSPAVTTTVDNCLVLRCHAISRSRAIIAPSGTTSIFNVNNGSGASVGMAHETLATAGTTGTRAFTYSSGTADRPVNGTVAIAPA